MPKGNNSQSDELREILERAQELLARAIALASGTSSPKTSGQRATKKVPLGGIDTPDFSMSLRAFAKKFGKGLSGPKKFVLLVAYLAKGKSATTVQLAAVEKTWNKLTSQLGGKFNNAYATRAREGDWVDTEKSGAYRLRPSWAEILK